MRRVKQVDSRGEMERTVDEFVTRGYKIESRYESAVIIKKEDWGDIEIHFLTAILTVWWTFGLANVLYAVYKRITAEKIIIRIGDKAQETYTNDSSEGVAKEDTSAIERKSLSYIFLQLFSVILSIFILIMIISIHTGNNGTHDIPPVVFMLAAAVLFRYVAIYHQFTKEYYKIILLIPTSVGLLMLVLYNIKQFLDDIPLDSLFQVFLVDSSVAYSTSLLPEWWVTVILCSAGMLILFGSLTRKKLIPYPRPNEIRTVATSPVFFGAVCAFFGLWAVLFVGISIQRIFIIAPIFEELLKFGVAILIGSSLFDRSILARIGVAVVVGTLFGLIEHATTYPGESDYIYLFRTLFHMMTTVLSVSVYTYFESRNMARLSSRAPIMSMLIHFFYNTFAVVSSIIATIVVGSQVNNLTLVYGGLAVLITMSLVVLTLLHHRVIHHLHMPFDNILAYLF